MHEPQLCRFCHASPLPPNRYQEVRERKLAQAAAACEKLLNDAGVRLAALARAEGATVEKLQREVAAFEQQYRSAPGAAGPTKFPRLAGATLVCCCLGDLYCWHRQQFLHGWPKS